MSEIKDFKGGKPLYCDSTIREDAPTRYFKCNTYLLSSVLNKWKLTACDIAIFFFICAEYDNPSVNPHYKGVALSYADLEKITSYSHKSVIRSIYGLIDSNLIKVVEEERKGRSKTRYVPNVPYIHELIVEYAKRS